MPAELLATRSDSTLILTISNPGRQNALDPEVCAVAIEVLSTAERDDAVRAVILTGSGPVFSSGADLHHLLERRPHDVSGAADSAGKLQNWIEAIRDCPKPVIAAVEGEAAGSGFALALACDLIVAGASASFHMPGAGVGLPPDGGSVWFLLQSLPRQLASEILFEGKPVAASRLHDLGAVNRLTKDGSALECALEWAERLASLPGNALETAKTLLRTAADNPLSQYFEHEKQAFLESLFHEHALEGIQARLQNRKPDFT